jgi:putative endonuclease
MYFVYVLKSQIKEKYYVGYTSNLAQRLQQHNSGATISTKAFRPWIIVYTEILPDKKSAWLREHQIKRYKGGEAFKKLLAKPSSS